MKNKVRAITIVFIFAITAAACEPSEKPAESLHPELTVQTTTTASQASITTFVQSSTPTVTTTATPPSTTQTKESSESETQATTQPQETSEIEELTPLLTDEDYTFVNEFGDVFDIRNADNIIGFYQNTKPEDMVKEKYYAIVNEKFTYLTKSIGVSYNSLDDPYDFETGAFDVEVPEQNYDWFKVYPGDKFESLTVEEVSIYYEYMNGVATTGGFNVSFSGSFTVTGYINCIIEDGAYVAKGDVEFSVDAETWGDIPILAVPRRTGYLPQSNYETETHDYFYASDIHVLNLGNIYRDDFSGVDMSLIPADGSYRRVSITLTDLVMWSKEGMTAGIYNAKIESISLLDE